ncbi:MAG: DUF885 domain-containing protein [Gemmatimonadales bacterium]
MHSRRRFGIAVIGALVIGLGTGQAQEYEAVIDELMRNPAGLSDSARLHALFEADWERALAESPESATYRGDRRYDDRWTDQSMEAIARRKARLPLALEVLEQVDREALSPTDRLNYDLFNYQRARRVEGSRFPGELMPINQMGGIQQGIPRLLAVMPKATAEDYGNIIARLEGIPRLVDQTIALMELGLERGITPPQITLRDVPQQVANLLTDDPLESPVLGPFRTLPGQLEDEARAELQQQAIAIFEEQVRPALERLRDFLRDEYLPGAVTSTARSDLPDGADWYAYAVSQYTTTNLSVEAIHQTGLAEVRRIRSQMDSIIEVTGFEGDFAEFAEFLRSDPRFFHTSAEALLAAYRDIAKRVDPQLPKLFGTLPRMPYGVIPIPSYAEKSQTTAYYQSGSSEAGRPGYFYANTYDLSSRPTWEMEALTIHEAVPGHHLQIALAHELEGVPKFRRFGGYTAFVEGWALYSESLGEEMGFYQDPYSKFGQLTYEIWRAIRLVVDTGMHALGWSRQDAIDFFKANTPKAEHDIVVEVDRYIVWPGQALAYKIGELKIKELRALGEAQLGDRFDIRAFHDEVLGQGAVPLDLLQARMEQWVVVRGG